jgi:hypothetical protein
MSDITKENARDVQIAREGIYTMCDWDDTEEGSEFWIDIVRRLDRISDNIDEALRPKKQKKL